jgi:hypothetical protein
MAASTPRDHRFFNVSLNRANEPEKRRTIPRRHAFRHDARLEASTMRAAWMIAVGLMGCGGGARDAEPIEPTYPPRPLRPAELPEPSLRALCTDIVAPYSISLVDVETRTEIAITAAGACAGPYCVDALAARPAECKANPPNAAECAPSYGDDHFGAIEGPVLCVSPASQSASELSINLPKEGLLSLRLDASTYMPLIVSIARRKEEQSSVIGALKTFSFAQLSAADGFEATMYSSALVVNTIGCDGAPIDATIDVAGPVVPFQRLTALSGATAFFIDYGSFETSVVVDDQDAIAVQVRGSQLSVVEWRPDNCE